MLSLIGGSDDFTLGASGISRLIGLFQERIAIEAKASQVINTGRMLSDENFKQTITESGGITTIDLFMAYYADFVNQGVKGVDDDSNAPNSPYQFKNYGMSEEGRKSILNSVVAGKMKIADTSKTKYGKIGLEAKGKDTPNQDEINQQEANQLIYLIKAFGIKETGFIDRAFKLFKDDAVDVVSDFVGKKVLFTITKGFK